jgi:hypothetical protein
MHRRSFLARTAGAAAALGVAPTPDGPVAAESSQQPASPDQWLSRMTAPHRCFFDFTTHAEGAPLILMWNYINTYREAYAQQASTINAIGSFYGPPGGAASMPLAWNDVVWEKYRIGELMNLVDPDTRAPTKRNLFFRPRAGDPVFMSGAVTGAGIENLQRFGATFLMCNNAFRAWMAFLSGNGTKGNAAEIEREIRANMIPGVIAVPAMVIAIEKAQGRGIAYKRQ